MQIEMNIFERVQISPKTPINYIPMGEWSDKETYSLSYMGIPVVEVKDDTAAGFSAYALFADKATVGVAPGASNEEWRLVESAEFLYMLQAYIKKLQATLVTAERIESLFIKTGNIEVTEGAKIAGFNVSGQGLTNAGFNNDAYIIIRNDVRDAADNYLYGTFVGIGGNVLPAMLGGVRAVGKFSNTMQNAFSDNYGIIVEASGGRNNTGIDCVGDLKLKGAINALQPYYYGAVYSNTIQDNIGKYNMFIFSTAEYRTVYLPDKSKIQSAYGTKNIPSDFCIKILVGVHRFSAGMINLEGSGSYLTDQNGSVVGGLGYGKMDMAKGDTVTLVYYSHSNYWQVVTHNK